MICHCKKHSQIVCVILTLLHVQGQFVTNVCAAAQEEHVFKKYSKESEQKLATVHPDLQKVFRRVLEQGFDHVILDGHRTKEMQDKAVATGHSTKPWPTGEHNKFPSEAVDALPYPFSWADLDGTNGAEVQRKATIAAAMFIGYVLRTAEVMFANHEITTTLRSGVDWDGDWNVGEHNFIDLPHFERVIK
jgi:hypothetical protein